MNILNEALSTMLQATILVIVPIVASAIIKLIRIRKDSLTASLENEQSKQYLEELTAAVSAAVAHTSQAYVDAVKADKQFNPEAQESALKMAMNIALNSITAEAKKFLSEHYDDIPTLIGAKIEEAVRQQKKGV